jgi:hypothetical protein
MSAPARACGLLGLALVAAPGLAHAQSAATAVRPWRAHEALGIPWLRFGLDRRTRYEHLEDDFRKASPGNAAGVFLRTLLSAELRAMPLAVGFEVQDSRAWATEATPLSASLVSPLELVQAYVAVRAEELLARRDRVAVTAGRRTLDLGSRRLVARNDFRNAIQAFTGVDIQGAGEAGDPARLFAVMPVERRPTGAKTLRDNGSELDRERTGALLWGAFVQTRPTVAALAWGGYVVGLHERNSARSPSPNRQLVTPGLRDAWTTAALADETGASGSCVGTQVEARARWHVSPRNLVGELGGAFLARGEFAIEAPGAKSAIPIFADSQIAGTL